MQVETRTVAEYARREDQSCERPHEAALPVLVKAAWVAMFGLLAVSAAHVINAIGHSEQRLPVWCTVFVACLGALNLRKQAELEAKSRSWAGAAVMSGMSAVNALATVFSLTTSYLLSYLGLIGSALWAISGWKYARHFTPVFAFACFGLVSLPDEIRLRISFPLQMLSSKILLTVLSPFVEISGIDHKFIVHGIAYDVAPGCSGLNQWIAFCYAFLIWQMFQRFTLKGWLVVLAAILPITLALNVVRLVVTALLAFYVSQDTALAVHSNLEYVLFPIGLLAIWAMARRHYAKT